MSSTASPRRVLYVHHRGEPSGASRALALLVEHLDRDRFEPHAYVPAGRAAELLRAAGASVHEGPVACFTHIWASTYRGPRWSLLGRELLRLPQAHRRLSTALAANRFAVVHLNDSPLVHAAWLARRRGAAVVWHLRSALPGGGVDARSRALRTVIERLADEALAINEDVARSFHLRARVVPDPVDLSRFRPGEAAEERAALGLAAGVPVVAFFGYLYPAKGFREFLAAAAVLRRRGVEARYLLVGGGVRSDRFFSSPAGRLLSLAGVARDHETEARALAAKLGVADSVRFLPFVADPAPLYRTSDVVVIPSRGPEIGLPAIEAAASGVPVVATGSPGGGGIVVPEETGLLTGSPPAAIADAVGTLLADPPLRARLGAAARRHAERTFDAARSARAVEAAYERLLAMGRR